MAPDPVRFRRLDDERVEVVLDRYEADVLLGLPDQVRELVELGEGAVHDRLFPRAHVDPTED
ncbi:MAG TPA: hypothetical protein VM618_07030, partial [Acidimicrobiia bacterium]|nr:hypothetical protein [Acidimicrobiia bacterium]